MIVGALTAAACGDNIEGSPLEVVASAPTLKVGATVHLTARIASGDTPKIAPADKVVWLSSDPSIVRVAAKGDGADATGVRAGTATITAAYDGKKATITLTVSAIALTSIEVTPSAPSFARGTSQALVATGIYSDGHKTDITAQAAWSTDDQTIASVGNTAANKGVLLGAKVGKTKVTATLDTVSGSTTATITDALLTKLQVTAEGASLAKGTTRALTATGTFSDDSTQPLSDQVTWTSSDETIVSLTAAGVARGERAGKATVTAKLGTITSAAFELTVTAAELVRVEVTPGDKSLAKGAAQDFTATGVFTDSSTQPLNAQVTWKSSNEAVATIDAAGHAVSLDLGETEISATFGVDAAAKTGKTTLTVTAKELMSLAISPAAPEIALGLSRDLVATGTYTDHTTDTLTAQAVWASEHPDVATISNDAATAGTASSVAIGTTKITAKVTTTTGEFTAETVLTVKAAELRTIAIDPPTPKVAKGVGQDFTATGTFTDGTTEVLTAKATWRSSDEAVAIVDNAADRKGKAATLGIGHTAISAVFAGVTGSTDLEVTKEVLVSLEVAPASPSLPLGFSRQFSATGIYSDQSHQPLTDLVTWESSDPEVASIGNDAGNHGLVHALKAGLTTIKATMAGVSDATVLIVTDVALDRIEITPAAASVPLGSADPYTATGVFSDDSRENLTAQVTWASSEPTVAIIDNAPGRQGFSTTLAEGDTTITATSGGASPVVGTTTLHVRPVELVSIQVTPAAQKIAKGLTEPMTATGIFSDHTTDDLTARATWETSDDHLVAVSNVADHQGEAKGIGIGVATLTATLGDVHGSTTLEVTRAELVRIEVAPALPSVAKGVGQDFTATGTFTDDSTDELTTAVTWASEHEDIATISNAADNQGKAQSLAVGATRISATLDGVTGSTVLTVTPAVLRSLAIDPATPELPKGVTRQLHAVGLFSDGSHDDLTTAAVWATSAPESVTVSNAEGTIGVAHAVAIGTSTVKATVTLPGGATLEAETLVTVSTAVLDSIAITPSDASIAKGLTQQLTATGTNTDGTTTPLTAAVTWEVATGGVASVSNAAGSEGLATALVVGDTTITATLGGVHASVAFHVTAARALAIVVTPAAPSFGVALTQQFVATATFTDNPTPQIITTQVTWTSDHENVATISNAPASKGLATGVAAGAARITATLDGVSGSTDATVIGLVSIALAPAPTQIDKGATVAYAAIGTYANASTQNLTGQVTWTSSDTNVATIGNVAPGNGAALTVGVGTTTITAAISGLTAVATLAVADCHVTINEVSTGGTAAADELVELYNGCPFAIDLVGGKLAYRSSTGTSDTALFNFDVATSIPAAGYLLYGGSAFVGTKDGLLRSGLKDTGGGVGLRRGNASLSDSVAWGDATNAFREGATAAAAPPAGQSISRFPADGTDTNVNAADFHLAPRTPRAQN